MKLTSKEIHTIKDLYWSASGNGFDFGFTDQIPSLKAASRGGLVASLIKKGLIEITSDEFNQFQFTGDFWKMIGTKPDAEDARYADDWYDRDDKWDAWKLRSI